jgi:hypothetical protein
MGRIIVLCLVFLSLLSFPGHACALGDSGVTGYLWLDNYDYAYNPSLVVTNPLDTKTATAAFTVPDINFDSRQFDQPQKVSFNQFLHIPDKDPYKQWTIPAGSSFDPSSQMFNNKNGKEGIFFQFDWDMTLKNGTLPFRITYDDGFFLRLGTGETFPVTDLPPSSGIIDVPITQEFSLSKAPGMYHFTLYYGAINDTSTHVIIFATPEPGSILLLGLGLAGIGFIMRKRL